MYTSLAVSHTCPTFIFFLIPSGRMTLSKNFHQVLDIYIIWSIPGRPSSLHMSIMTHVEKSLAEHLSSVQLYLTLYDPHGLQHARLPWPSPTQRVSSNSCPLSWWCHPMSPSTAPALPLSQHQGLFQWVHTSHQMAKVLEFQHQSFQGIFMVEFL